MNVLAIGSHQDDLELGCAATLCRYVANGAEVILVVATLGDDEPEARFQVREAEARAAAEMIGAKEVVFLKQPDNALAYNGELVATLDRLVKEHQVGLMFAPWLKETHPDHEVTGKLALSACRRGCDLLFYEGPGSYEFTPSVFCGMSTFELDRKLEVLGCHRSQVERPGSVDLLAWAVVMANTRGQQSRQHDYAEGFVAYRWHI